MADENAEDPEIEAFLAEAARSGLLNDLGRIRIAGSGLADGMKAEVIKEILKASLAARGKSLSDLLRQNPKILLPDGSKAFVSNAGEDPSDLAVSVLSQKDLAAMEEAAQLAELRKTEKGYLADGDLVRVRTSKGNEVVPAEYFFRTCPYEKILAWGADLFFFSTGFPLDLRGSAASDANPETGEGARNETRPEASSDTGLIKIILARPLMPSRTSMPSKGGAEPAEEKPGGPDPEAGDFNRVLDKLMPLPENEQMDVFIRDHLAGADPDSSATADLAGAFFQSNLNTVIFDITDLAAGFDCLEELYFNKALAFRIAGLWSRFRETKTGTECLFYFASQYEFERRALERLFKAQAEAEAYLAGRSATAELFEKERKCQVVRDIGRKVLAEMKKHGYAGAADVLIAYRGEQKRIYDYLIERGGEDRDRGLFALGCFYWEMDRSDLAIQAWMDIRPSHGNPTFNRIRGILSGADHPNVMIMKINGVLDRAEIQGTDEFLLRLVRYGKWKIRGG